jgi:microsomal epoxide hydrolase
LLRPVIPQIQSTTSMTSAKNFNNVPAGASPKPTPFELRIEEEKLQDFKTLLRLSPVGKKTYENLREDGELGISHKWMVDAKKHWEENFDWCAKSSHVFSRV